MQPQIWRKHKKSSDKKKIREGCYVLLPSPGCWVRGAMERVWRNLWGHEGKESSPPAGMGPGRGEPELTHPPSVWRSPWGQPLPHLNAISAGEWKDILHCLYLILYFFYRKPNGSLLSQNTSLTYVTLSNRVILLELACILIGYGLSNVPERASERCF